MLFWILQEIYILVEKEWALQELAIRPSIPALTPDEVEQSISGDTAKLYRLIWSRFMASQMADCRVDLSLIHI